MIPRENPDLYLDLPDSSPPDVWDADVEVRVRRVLPGQHRISRDPGMALVTVLGSCVAACIGDPMAGVGGLNHFMLPGEVGQSQKYAASGMRYGQFAMERLIHDLLAEGAHKDRLEGKIFGGAAMFKSSMPIGISNIKFVEGFLKEEKIKILAHDVGGLNARRIYYFPVTGRVICLELRRQNDRKVFDNEIIYGRKLKVARTAPEFGLF
jgi:chemotaxis protein CheD